MKILILTDSRGFCPGDNKNWVDKFVKRNKNYNIIKKNWIGKRLETIYDHLSNLKIENKKYNIIIIQNGYKEYIHWWSKNIIQKTFEKFDQNINSNITKLDNRHFRYRNDKLIQNTINNIKQYCDYLLLLGMHTSNIKHEKITLIMNKVFSENIDYLNLPMHFSWTKIYGWNDNIHYSDFGDIFLYQYIERYVKKCGKSINNILQQYE